MTSPATARRLGDYLECPAAQIELALLEPLDAVKPSKRLGERLLDRRSISSEGLHRALRAQRVDRLRDCALFADFPPTELERLASDFEEVTVAAGMTFIRQGRRENHLFVLASGSVEIYRETADGERLDLAIAHTGEPIGEIGYVSGGMRSATVTALSRCELLSVSFDQLRNLLDEVPRLAHRFLDTISRRLLNTTERFEAQHHRLRRVERSLDGEIIDEASIDRAFRQSLSPKQIEQLRGDPGKLALRGERREVSALFTDIEDFTRLAERVDPEVLTTLLSAYFDGACDIVLRHGGTIDKIVGDSLHVLFNAPTDQADHASRAVSCALELGAFSRSVRARNVGTGLMLGDTRVGINTGRCVVGNFGGTSRFDYTAHGHAINIASGLENANKHLGTLICVSEATRSRCEGIQFRPIGRLMLEGRSEGVDIHEPMSVDDYAVRARREEYDAAYELLANEDAHAKEYFKQLARRYPEDRLVRFHAERLERTEASLLIRLR